MPFRRNTRPIISNPELQSCQDAPSPFELTNHDFTNPIPPQSAYASQRQSIVSSCESSYPRADDSEDGPAEWTIAPPRLSPMEFARSRLIQTALDRREDDSVSSGLTKAWFWTPRWESFLVIPYKDASPHSAPTQDEPQHTAPTFDLNSNADFTIPPETDGLAQAETDRRSFLACPRLSLNLGNIAIQFPSMLNLMSLDAIHPFRSLSSSTKSASPPGSGESTRAARRSGIYGGKTVTAPVPYSLGRGSQNERTNQELSLSFPAVHNIDRYNFQETSSHSVLEITDNPFQDSAIYKRAQSPETSPSAAAPWALSGRAPAGLRDSVDRNPPVVATASAPRNFGLFPSSAIAQRLHQRPRRVVGGQIVTPVAARKVGRLVAGGVGGSVMSLHATQSEDFALPDASDEERELRPPPLHVVRQRSSPGRGLRERDTTRRNLFRGSDDGEDDWHGLLRHLGDAAAAQEPPENEERRRRRRPAPWSPLYASIRHGSGSTSSSQPETPSTRRQSSVLSHLSITPTALRLAGSPRLMQRAQDDDQEEHSGLSPRQRKVASTYQPLPDSPTLPVVGPQVTMTRSSRHASHGSL